MVRMTIRTAARPLRSILLAALAVAAVAPLPALAQANADLPPITVDDYGQWKRITSTAMSPDGAWMTYGYAPLEGEDTLFIQELDGGGMETIARGGSAAFSPDGEWVGYIVSPEEGDDDADRQLQLRNLTTGATRSFVNAAGFSFPDNTGLVLIRKRGAGNDADWDGADLVVHDLTSGTSLNLGNVSDYGVNDTGTHLAYLVDAQDDAGNGAYLLDLSTNAITPLRTESATFDQLTWNADGTGLAFLEGTVPEGMEQRESVLQIHGDIAQPQRHLTADFDTDGLVISHLGGIRWSESGDRIWIGLKEQREERKELEDRGVLNVWHWADTEVQSQQEVRANRDLNATWTAVVNLGGGMPEVVRLADPALESVSPAGETRYGIGRDGTPYAYEVAWGGSNADYYRVDLDTGERTLMAEGVGRTMGTSDDGETWLYLRNEEIIARDIASGDEVNLTASSGIDFIDRQDDHPYELPIHGVAGWTRDNDEVLLYDRYDLWAVPLDGGDARNLTSGKGAAEQIRYRRASFRDVGPAVDEEDGVDLSEPMLLSAFGTRTKWDGYVELQPDGELQELIWEDMSVGTPMQAGDRMAFTLETFVEYPDWWISDENFENRRKITDANPQQADFAWSPGRVLIDYVDDRGNELQGTLALPANYEEGKQYPMLVYFYELMSDRHHSYQGPAFDDRPHMATYASNGYLVLQPDIVYSDGKPGSSALDDLTSAVEKVIEMGYADPDAIGLQGHSWGGYQSSFVVTQTDLFSAVVTGAPPTNLVSFYNTLYRSSGSVQQGITEVGQVRMGTTPFEDFELYVSQSPVHQAENITTPFMILHGEEDGAVDWMQGLEYFNMARRLGKEVIFLSYPGEGHHLGRKGNQIDFQIRMMQFFDYHLRDALAPAWMIEGVKFLDRDYANPRTMIDGSMWRAKPITEEGAGGAN